MRLRDWPQLLWLVVSIAVLVAIVNARGHCQTVCVTWPRGNTAAVHQQRKVIADRLASYGVPTECGSHDLEFWFYDYGGYTAAPYISQISSYAVTNNIVVSQTWFAPMLRYRGKWMAEGWTPDGSNVIREGGADTLDGAIKRFARAYKHWAKKH